MKISAVVLTKNEEKNIEKCLKSLVFADEIIIVDDESTDKTIEKVHKVLKVYRKAGKKCPKCGTIIKRIAMGQRSVFFCPECQNN